MIHKRVSILLVVRINKIVSNTLSVVYRVGNMPFKQRVQSAEEDADRTDLRKIISEFQIILIGFIARVADIHIKRCPGDLSPHIGRWFPRVCVFACKLRFRVAGLLVLGITGVAGVVNLVGACRVHAGVSRSQIMKVGVCRTALVDSVAVRPEVLSVPAGRSSEVGYGFRSAAVNQYDAV